MKHKLSLKTCLSCDADEIFSVYDKMHIITLTNCSYSSLTVFSFWFWTTRACWRIFCCCLNRFYREETTWTRDKSSAAGHRASNLQLSLTKSKEVNQHWASLPAPQLAGLQPPTAVTQRKPAGSTGEWSSACKYNKHTRNRHVAV